MREIFRADGAGARPFVRALALPSADGLFHLRFQNLPYHGADYLAQSRRTSLETAQAFPLSVPVTAAFLSGNQVT